ncbi:FAD-binding oxidoreductase, partial [Candidatus Kaiserbacteria bacterium]|nr:FAD-binding oxidoreductase [Candidatus Kaiserbacteria bacterium]
MDFQKELESIFSGKVSIDDETLEINSEDTSIFHVRPKCVVYPKDVQDVQSLLKFAADNPEVTLTARAAGTDMSGGPLTDSVVVSMTKHFNKIYSVSEEFAVTQPGVFYRDLEKETLKQGVILPCYTASKELNTVGGMVANNSAGEKSLTYGKTEKWVRSIKMVLSDGNEYEFHKLTREDLEAKKSLDTFEGQLYRDIDWIIHEKIDILRKEKPVVSKNSAGYSVWNIWDEEADTFDLTQLIVGSQGTLGIITEITFALMKPKKHARMLVMFLRDKHMKVLGEMVNTVL